MKAAVLLVGDPFLAEEKYKALFSSLQNSIPGEIPQTLYRLSDVPLEWAVLPSEQSRVPKTYVWNNADNAPCSQELDDLRTFMDSMRLSATYQASEFNLLLGDCMTVWQAGNL